MQVIEQALWVKNIRHCIVGKHNGAAAPKRQAHAQHHLVKAPRECIDYVILHELCHIAEHNHSKKFYRLMTQVMPSWEKVKAKLDGMVEKIF